jgi:hypothetical protein
MFFLKSTVYYFGDPPSIAQMFPCGGSEYVRVDYVFVFAH